MQVSALPARPPRFRIGSRFFSHIIRIDTHIHTTVDININIDIDIDIEGEEERR